MSKEIRQLLIIGAVIVGIVAVVGGVAWYKNANAPVASEAIVRDTSHSTGASDAVVTLVEFGDYQCPACGQAEPVLEQIRQDYADKSFRFVFRNFPLTIHANAPAAANAAEAAAAQGKFWEMHDALYANQAAWESVSNPTSLFSDYAKNAGIGDLAKYDNELKSNAYSDVIKTDQKDGTTLNVQVTPTFFLNGEKLEGVQDYDTLKQKIDQLLADATQPQQASDAAQTQ
jgi:protein-disulfide isomerase